MFNVLAGTKEDPLKSVRRFGVCSVVVVPVLGPEEGRGILYLDSSLPARFCLDQVRTLEGIAAVAGPALARLSTDLLAKDQAPVVETSFRFGSMVAVSKGMREVVERLRRASGSSTPLLIHGESGVGKELAARGVHEASERKNSPFIAVDCGALTDTLAEAELFGCIRGAFSGANESRPGLLEAADGGTLFLDEVGNLPTALQPKLLRALQEGEVRRVGSTQNRAVNFRLVAATNVDLALEVEQGRFRRDLYYRLAGMEVVIPPLRERPNDVDLLASEYLKELNQAPRRRPFRISLSGMGFLRTYHWPGNVRQLRNLLATAVALADDDVLTEAHLRAEIEGGRAFNSPRRSTRMQIRELEDALRETSGDKTAAARMLGWSRMRVYRVLERARRAGILKEPIRS
jgi:transcriptional regulator with PAS, ATPase and Fis domain